MSRALDDLDPLMRRKAFELLARLVEANIAIMIVDTLRTPEEHQQNLSHGVSWVKQSRHLPNAMGKSEAIDICPYATYALHGKDKLAWEADDLVWPRIGEIGESIGLKWGGRWKQRDLGHFEL